MESVGRELGPSLTQVVNRMLVWWVHVPNDIMRGDVVEVVFQPREAEEPIVHALKFKCSKLGKEVSAFRFQAPGANFARYYSEEGEELEERLVPSPLEDYEQITSLLRDGRGHKGVDFKTPVGTTVKATFNGVITRRNWNFRSNGNCLELTESRTGKRALFLHLAELPPNVRVGTKVTLGQPLARSGNSGRSFAPHLHYQLMNGDTALDPFKVHATKRATLSGASLVALKESIRQLHSYWGQIALAPHP